MYCLDYHFCVISFSYVRLKAQKYFVSSSCMFLGKKTLLKITLPGLNLTVFRRTGPRVTEGKRSVTKNHSTVIESPWLFHWLDVKKYSIIPVLLRISIHFFFSGYIICDCLTTRSAIRERVCKYLFAQKHIALTVLYLKTSLRISLLVTAQRGYQIVSCKRLSYE